MPSLVGFSYGATTVLACASFSLGSPLDKAALRGARGETTSEPQAHRAYNRSGVRGVCNRSSSRSVRRAIVASGAACDVAHAETDACRHGQSIRRCDWGFLGRPERFVYAVAAASGAPRARSSAIEGFARTVRSACSRPRSMRPPTAARAPIHFEPVELARTPRTRARAEPLALAANCSEAARRQGSVDRA